ncbi:MAG TPA: hypothetical protein PKX93_11710, partial [bacterium]|nr:hypothetical protein [bacterium]
EYNCWGRRRLDFAFQHLFQERTAVSSGQITETVSFDPHRQTRVSFKTGQLALSEFHHGRVAYLPQVHYVHQPRSFRSGYNVRYDGIDSRYWKEPYNVAEILEILTWLAGDVTREFLIFGFPELRVDWLAWEDGFSGLSLVRCGPLAGPVDIPLRVKSVTAPVSGLLLSPERSSGSHLAWKKVGENWWETMLPGIGRHGLARWKSGS